MLYLYIDIDLKYIDRKELHLSCQKMIHFSLRVKEY